MIKAANIRLSGGWTLARSQPFHRNDNDAKPHLINTRGKKLLRSINKMTG
ncbi:hypothetical protein RSc3432 [Ralstonia pseudosolanacearum GMI1000]|uniref:Uncharacterized protein n=1 Tax=Ralstonia nicotianae (strain ATCC BAA-1114 / GMI1000) TaxID=267608 RepID=Q8XTW4_RALN1|nr:hypothetical protein RSc3432 [Ralstonia pseudosolanacearum GMI1000]